MVCLWTSFLLQGGRGTLHFGYKNQSVSAVYGKSCCLFWEPHKTNSMYQTSRIPTRWHYIATTTTAGHQLFCLPQMFVNTVNWAPDDGCGTHPKNVERVILNNKVLYSVIWLELLKFELWECFSNKASWCFQSSYFNFVVSNGAVM
jgi:hypothetical protein